MGYYTTSATCAHGIEIDLDTIFDIIVWLANTSNNNEMFKKYKISILPKDRIQLRNMVTDYNNSIDDNNYMDKPEFTGAYDTENNFLEYANMLNNVLNSFNVHLVVLEKPDDYRNSHSHDKTQIKETQYYLCIDSGIIWNSLDSLDEGCNKKSCKPITDNDINDFIMNCNAIGMDANVDGMDANVDDVDQILVLSGSA
jgi:hypothetical protein